jgi:hypothetical protein
MSVFGLFVEANPTRKMFLGGERSYLLNAALPDGP